jgi:hypothetical protein
LNIVRQVFSNKKFPSVIAALKQAIAIHADDPAAAGRIHTRAGKDARQGIKKHRLWDTAER